MFLPRLWPVQGILRLPTWGTQGRAHRLRTSLTVVRSVLQGLLPPAYPQGCSSGRMGFQTCPGWGPGLGRAACGRAPVAELLRLGASTSGLDYSESQRPWAFIPAVLTHASVVTGSLCSSCARCRLSACVSSPRRRVCCLPARVRVSAPGARVVPSWGPVGPVCPRLHPCVISPLPECVVFFKQLY